jgi:hypothetical protein
LTEVFLGGARGGGKTDGVLGKWALKERRYGSHFNAVMFRRTTVSAEDAIARAKEIYGRLGGRFNEARLRWRMPHECGSDRGRELKPRPGFQPVQRMAMFLVGWRSLR